MKTLSEIIKDRQKQRAGVPTDNLMEVHNAWMKIAGPLGRLTRAGKYTRGVVVIIVASSTVVQELRFTERALLEAMRGEMGDKPVKQLRFQTGKVIVR